MFYILNANGACFSVEPDLEAKNPLEDKKLIGCKILGDEHSVIEHINESLPGEDRLRPDEVRDFKEFCEDHGYKVFFIEPQGESIVFKSDVSNERISGSIESFISTYQP